MPRIKTVLSLAAPLSLALVAAPMLAQMGPMQAPGAPDPARVTAGTYRADSSHSLIGWKVNHLGFNDYFGLFGDVAGTLTLDPANPNAAAVDVTIPVSKITTANAALTAHLLRAGPEGGKPDFFGPAPADAHFVSNHVETNGTSAMIHGDLTLNGVTKPVMIAAQFAGAGKTPPMMGNKDMVGFHGQATIKRSEFGLGGYVPLVGDEVKLDITIAFAKQ